MNETLKQVAQQLDGVLACAVVDLSTGMMLGTYHNIPYFTQAYLDAVGAAAVDMFRGQNIQAIEHMLALQRGEDVIFHTYKLQMSSESTYHFISLVKDKPDALFVMVTSKQVNLGMAWNSSYQACAELTPFCP